MITILRCTTTNLCRLPLFCSLLLIFCCSYWQNGNQNQIPETCPIFPTKSIAKLTNTSTKILKRTNGRKCQVGGEALVFGWKKDANKPWAFTSNLRREYKTKFVKYVDGRQFSVLTLYLCSFTKKKKKKLECVCWKCWWVKRWLS